MSAGVGALAQVMDTSTISRNAAGDPRATEARTIEFFFDPLCPWCWITSRWVAEVASSRQLEVRWRLISLAVLNGGEGAPPPPPEYASAIRVGTELMRVMAAAKQLGNEQLGDLYTELGIRIHEKGAGSRILSADAPLDAHREIVAEALTAAGLPAELLGSLDDAGLDRTASEETAEALSRTGEDVGTPIITFDPDNPAESSFFGPVLNRIPRGDEAVELFDLVERLAATPGLSEIKRSLRGAPSFD